uniref:Secreted protein n=1 Tax=Anguilla anguilla TaxID=7936 RepID=A0A0E9UJR4_ANGAN
MWTFFVHGVLRFFLCACVCSQNIYPVAHYVNCRFIRNTSIRLTQQLHMKLTLQVFFNVKCIFIELTGFNKQNKQYVIY